MSMQIQARKDKASTLVKVVTLTITQKNMTDFDASVTETNSTEWYKSVMARVHVLHT